MAEEQVEDRRLHDRTHTDIRELILKTDAPKDKAMLLILLKISESLETNTLDTQEIKAGLKSLNDKYEAHETDDKVRSGSFKTGWIVLSGVLVILQAITMVAVKSHMDEDKALNLAVVNVTESVRAMRRDIDLMQERRRIEDEVLRRETNK